MKALLLAGLALCLVAPAPARALTIEVEVTPEYVRSHPKEFAVKVAEEKGGLLAFTVALTLKEPRYVVAHLAVRDAKRTFAESDTPAFTRNPENTFYFSIAPQLVATSGFSLGVSGISESEGQALPIVGTIIYQFRLAQFVPARPPSGR